MPDLAISSWSLHRTLGPIYAALDVHPGERAIEMPYGPGHLCLLDAPANVAALGISTVEVSTSISRAPILPISPGCAIALRWLVCVSQPC
jgi:hypothetical protein